MKKIGLVGFALVFSFIVTGCSFNYEPSNSSSIQDSTSTVDEAQVELIIDQSQFARIGAVGTMLSDIEFENSAEMLLSSEKHTPIIRITDVYELIALSETISSTEGMNLNFNNDNSLETVFEKYDEQYFVKNNLLITSMQAFSGGISFEFEDAVIADNTLQITVKQVEPEMGTSDMADWIGVFEISKKHFNEDLKLDAIIE